MAAKTPSKTAGKVTAKSTVTRKAPKPKAAPAKSTTAKAARTPAKTTAKPTAKPVAKSGTAAPSLTVVKKTTAASAGPELKKRELLDLVVDRSGVKKKFAKPVMEALIDAMGQALAEGRALNLQPLGRILPKRTKEAGSNRVITARIRQSITAEKEKSEPTAAIPNPPVAKPAE